MRQDGGPSIEDILGSIKRVMARDNRTSAQELDQPAEAETHDDLAIEAEQPEPADAEEAEDVLGVTDLTSDSAGEHEVEPQPQDHHVYELAPEEIIPHEHARQDPSSEHAPDWHASHDGAPGEIESSEHIADESALEESHREGENPDDAAGDAGEPPEPLTSEDAATAMRRSLESLALLGDEGAGKPRLRATDTSLEGMVRAMLRPMLAQWLEDNLPEIVERQVQAEITRIMSKRS